AVRSSSACGRAAAGRERRKMVLRSTRWLTPSGAPISSYDENSRRMVLLEVLPGKTAKDIQELVSFELLISPDLKDMVEPSENDLKLLREKCDPDGYFLKRKVK
ncbi:MAG: hypothetical protein PHR86_07875, partial [Desulfobacterales bacterium]|nr:hypothetical protein [Desulfobacterales bacterium]